MSRKYLTGDDEIERTLSNLANDKTADRIAKSVLGAGLTPLARGMRAAAPVLTGETRKSIGRRLERNKRSGFVTAKVGVDVGKAKSGKKKSEYAYIVALRTHFVRTGYESARAAATSAMRARAAKRLVIEAAKARKT